MVHNDLISRSALLEELCKGTIITDDLYGMGIMAGNDHAIKKIKEAPAVEAVPVRHGRWIHCNGKSNLWYCSECGEKILYNQTRRTYNIEKRPVHEVNKYCRGCGENMDGGNNNGICEKS